MKRLGSTGSSVRRILKMGGGGGGGGGGGAGTSEKFEKNKDQS